MRPLAPGLRTLALVLPALLAGCDGASPLEPGLEGEVEAFVSLVNEHRASVGCSALRWNADVAEVALAHSQDMIDYRRMAENIARGFETGASVLDAWLGSPGHRTNIENCQLQEHGVGLVDGHWTHLFATV